MTKKKTKKDAKIVADKIKMAMLESGFNQMTLAKELGLTQSAVSKWLNGASVVSMKSLYAIAALTGKPVNYFFDNSTDVKGNNNVVGHNIKVTPDDDLHKDVKLLSVQVELLNTKMKLLEEEIKKIKRTTYPYDAGKEG